MGGFYYLRFTFEGLQDSLVPVCLLVILFTPQISLTQDSTTQIVLRTGRTTRMLNSEKSTTFRSDVTNKIITDVMETRSPSMLSGPQREIRTTVGTSMQPTSGSDGEDNSVIVTAQTMSPPLEDALTELVTELVNISFTDILMETVIVTDRLETDIVTELNNSSVTDLTTEKERKLCCPEGFTEVGDGCFLFQDDEVNNMQALELCSFHNEGSLAKIDPLVPVTTYLLEVLQFYIDVEFVWIGLQRAENDSFTWSFDESFLNASNWGVGQPINNTNLQCVAVNRNGTWEIRSCVNTEIPYLCQAMQVSCAELTTAPEVTTDLTTAEFTEDVTNATTTTTRRLTTTVITEPPSTTTKPPSTTTKPPKRQTTVDGDEEDATTEMITFDESTRPKSTTKRPTTTTTSPTTISVTTTTVLSTSPTKISDRVFSSSSMTSVMVSGMDAQKNVTSTIAISDKTSKESNGPTKDVNPTRPVVSMTTDNNPPPPPPPPQRSPLSAINKFLISIIVIFFVLALIIGAIVVYLFYKRKQSKKAVYDVEEAELDDIKSIEDIAGPSTSSDTSVTGGIANTSFVNDELPGFSASHFGGLRGKRASYDIT